MHISQRPRVVRRRDGNPTLEAVFQGSLSIIDALLDSRRIDGECSQEPRVTESADYSRYAIKVRWTQAEDDFLSIRKVWYSPLGMPFQWVCLYDRDNGRVGTHDQPVGHPQQTARRYHYLQESDLEEVQAVIAQYAPRPVFRRFAEAEDGEEAE